MKPAGYKLFSPALRDVAGIISYLHRETSATQADRIEAELFVSFSDLVTRRLIGHRRPDLTDRKVLFEMVGSYMIVFRRRDERVEILRVLHGSRDLSRLI